MRTYIIIIFLLTSSLQNSLYAQSQEEISRLLSNELLDNGQKSFTRHMDNSSSSGQFFGQLFLFYKAFFSSQDFSSCSFHPSCSVYALESVSKLGLLTGIMDTFDRLTRCNGLSPEKYIINQKFNLLEDGVRTIKYEIPE